jgi:hypothetical protein
MSDSNYLGSPRRLETTRERRAAADRRPLREDKPGPLQVLDQALGDDFGHDLVGVVDTLATVEALKRLNLAQFAPNEPIPQNTIPVNALGKML